jgi:hypothetical protein
MTKKESFLLAIDNVCRFYGLSLAHEDSRGGFIIDPYKEKNIKWLFDALIEDSELKLKLNEPDFQF